MDARVSGTAWILDEDGDEWVEGEKVAVSVAASDVDEVRIGIVVGGDGGESVTVYFSRRAADALARFLAAAVAAEAE